MNGFSCATPKTTHVSLNQISSNYYFDWPKARIVCVLGLQYFDNGFDRNRQYTRTREKISETLEVVFKVTDYFLSLYPTSNPYRFPQSITEGTVLKLISSPLHSLRGGTGCVHAVAHKASLRYYRAAVPYDQCIENIHFRDLISSSIVHIHQYRNWIEEDNSRYKRIRSEEG